MKTFLLCAATYFSGLIAFSQNAPEVSSDEIPRIPATEPGDALNTFEIEDGFTLSLAAAEPDVTDPIAMAFDEKGRAYVIEMRGYSERRDDAICRIRLLTDIDHDGDFEQSVVFKEGLKWPTAILCYRGGVFVGATPDVYFLRDNDGDGISDEERLIFTGFGEGKLELNMQALFNSLRWGPDNRIWGATAGNGGTVTRPDDPSFAPVPLRGADFSFDPERLDLRPENGTAQYGMSFDSLGRRFVCSNSRHLIWVAYERHQVKDNPLFSLPPALVDIADDGAAAPVYRISADEPWRIVRTRWRVSGVVKGTVEGGGRVSGYFTSATGVHLYWGDSFGDEYRDNAFIGDVGSNLVHRKVIVSPPDSIQLVASRPNAAEKVEFLRSRDNWFRPTSFASGPDGCLYVTDMYREVIEHPWSLPEPIKKHLDLNSGNDRGRIYRVAPDGFKPQPFTDPGSLSDPELVILTEHSNDWHRTTARRLLYERGKASPPLTAYEPFPALLSSESPLLELIRSGIDDKWLEASILNSLRTADDLENAWNDSIGSSTAFRSEIAKMVGRLNNKSVLNTVIRNLANGNPDRNNADLLEGLRDGMSRNDSDWKELASSPLWEGLISRATRTLTGKPSEEASTLASVRILALLASAESQDLFQSALHDENHGPAITVALTNAITDLAFLIGRFASLDPSAREELAGRILADKRSSITFLRTIGSGGLILSDVPASLLTNLRQQADKEIQNLVNEILPPVVSRSEVVVNYQPALVGKGDPKSGKLAFMKACVSCHQSPEGEGISLGPPVATFSTSGAETILGHILDPNREVAPQYQAYTFEFIEGPALTGIILSENSTEVTLRMPGGMEKTFPRNTVATMSGLGQSLMPEGLEASVSIPEMTDLLAYLLEPRANN